MSKLTKNPFEDDITAMSLSQSTNKESSGVPAPETKATPSLNKILNLTQLCEDGKNELIEILISIRGKKSLVVEPQLSGLLNLILTDNKVLKDNGVTNVRELKSEGIEGIGSDGNIMRDIPDNIVFLLRPHLNLVRTIAQQVRSYMKAGARCQYHVYFIPQRTVVCEQILEDEGVFDHVEIGEYHLNFIPFEHDILSLELDNVFRQCYVDGDTSPLNVIARALCRFQDKFGVIPHVKSKGAASRKVVQKMFHIRREENSQGPMSSDQPMDLLADHDVDTLVILDREVDLVSPMVTPLTYEGLIDDILGIENNRVKIDATIAGEEKDDAGQITTQPTSNILTTSSKQNNASQPGKVTIILDSEDLMYNEVRNLSIEKLGAVLQEKAIKIRELYSSFRENKDASLLEIHQFVKKIPHLTKEFKYLQRHINIAGFLKSFTDSREFRDMWQGERGILEGEPFLDQIEDMICADVSRVYLMKVLRFLCLQSLTSGGIRTSRYEAIKKLIIQNYGFEELFTLTNLERAGLLKKKDTSIVLVDGPSVWQGLRKQLKLIEEESEKEEFSYVAAGYSPLLVRIVQTLGRPSGWATILDAMRLLPGPLLEVTQTSIAEELSEALNRPTTDSAYQTSQLSIMGEDPSPANKRNMLVVVIGGLTFLEVAAFRFLSNDPNFPYRIIMATTKLVTGATLLKSLTYKSEGIKSSVK